MRILVDDETKSKYSGVCIASVNILGIKVEDSPNWLLSEMEKAVAEIRTKYASKNLLDDPITKAYRKFFRNLGIDPTKTRSSGEALIRMALKTQKLPKINGVVDSMNVLSARIGISASAFDMDKIEGDIVIRLAEKREQYMAHGKEIYTTTGGKLVIADMEKILCFYPYRDNIAVMITRQTRNAVLQTHGVPGINPQLVQKTVEETLAFVLDSSGGSSSEVSLIVL